MTAFKTKILASARDVLAPDGMDVRLLLDLAGGSMAHFELCFGGVSIAVAHRTVEEIWFILAGHGQMWRKIGVQEEITMVVPGICVTIPLHTHFQVRCTGNEPLTAIAVTMPPWPGPGEAFEVEGKWVATVCQS